MADYHAALTSGRPFDAVTDAAKLDAERRGQHLLVPSVFWSGWQCPSAIRRERPNKVGRLEQRRRADQGTACRAFRITTRRRRRSTKNFGRFEIVAELGHGGLGVVLLARRPDAGPVGGVEDSSARCTFYSRLAAAVLARSESGRAADASQSRAGLRNWRGGSHLLHRFGLLRRAQLGHWLRNRGQARHPSKRLGSSRPSRMR